jgi:hypothetical protein
MLFGFFDSLPVDFAAAVPIRIRQLDNTVNPVQMDFVVNDTLI